MDKEDVYMPISDIDIHGVVRGPGKDDLGRGGKSSDQVQDFDVASRDCVDDHRDRMAPTSRLTQESSLVPSNLCSILLPSLRHNNVHLHW
jgi:hypothetical protein